MSIKRFPDLAHQSYDDNPAIQIFGRRFYKDQTEIEYLSEFLLVFLSPKYITDRDQHFGAGFPTEKDLESWPENTTLKYIPEERLSLKLFTFFGTSKLETRHNCHREQLKQIEETLMSNIDADYNIKKDQVLELLEQFLGGFVGVAANRTWCTQVFLPISQGLIAGETMWRRLRGNKNPDISWDDALKTNGAEELFSFTNHDFMARGGESLYLQLCNLKCFFNSQELTKFENSCGYESGSGRKALVTIKNGLEALFQKTSPISKIVQWLETADPETRTLIKERRQSAQCGWCPEESWQEAYLFAKELANICQASIDPVEKIEMLNLCCVFQVLRSICSQSVRYSTVMNEELRELGGINGFAWILTPAKLDDPTFKEAAKHNLVRMREVIYGALKSPNIRPATSKSINYQKKADEQSQELFVHLAKRIGLIAPRTGSGARFVLSEKNLRYLVLALIQPGKKMTLASFTNCMFTHYGMAISGGDLNKAVQWSYPRQELRISELQTKWLEVALLSSGFLIPLSDAVSQVENPFGMQDSCE